MILDIAEFKRFIKTMTISTKEFGMVSLGDRWSGTQEYFLQEVAKALAEDKHYLVILKGRQVMISTACLALDLYWHFKYPGTSGTLITDTEENREYFRETMQQYIDSLPVEWKQPIRTHNRTQLVAGNNSRIVYQVAGTKKKTNRSVGVGKAVSFMHATEVANWGDQGALADIEASLAQQNPFRLYIFESTARGFNAFEDMWKTAKRSRTQAAIFVGWWRNHLYRKEVGSPEYTVYWDGRMTEDETRWVRDVKRQYDYDIVPEQLAWWRWQLAEHFHEEMRMYQEFPPTEQDAFVTSGTRFFHPRALTERIRKVKSAPDPDYYTIALGQHWEDTQLVDANEDLASLLIWKLPKRGSYYVVGGDPAYGSSGWGDRSCAQVYECFADGMDQVAEFCTKHCSTYQFAWVLCYLASAYGPAANSQVMLNLEINGPGMAVWNEIQNMRRTVGMPSGVASGVGLFLQNIENYLYKRGDSIGGGFNYHFKTDAQTKERMFNAFKDGFERQIITVNSLGLLEEMGIVERDDDGLLGAPGRKKDDRVVASALSTAAWGDFIRIRLMHLGWLRSEAEKNRAPGTQTPVERAVMQFLQNRGLKPDDPARTRH